MSAWPYGGLKVIYDLGFDEFVALQVVSRQNRQKIVNVFDDWTIRRGLQDNLNKKFFENLQKRSLLISQGGETDVQVPVGLYVLDGLYEYKQIYNLSSGMTEIRFFTLTIEDGKARIKRVS